MRWASPRLPTAAVLGLACLTAPRPSHASRAPSVGPPPTEPAATEPGMSPTERGAPGSEGSASSESSPGDTSEAPPASDSPPVDPGETPASEPADAGETSASERSASPSSSRPSEPRPSAEGGSSVPDDSASPDRDDSPADATTSEPAIPAQDPPRIDGPYVGGVFSGGLTTLRVNDFDTSGVFAAWGGYFAFGQMVLPWLGLGLQLGGVTSYGTGSPRQGAGQGAIMVDFRFVPLPKKLNLSLRGSFGFGAGAVTEDGRDGRSGFGGAYFGAAVRYEFFPGAKRYRANRGGGFGLGPEIGWLGATPAARGRPLSNTVFIGLATTWYFGD